MIKETVNTFMGGMDKDSDKSILPKNKYLDALNYRLITTEGSTTGSLENIKGTKFLLDVPPVVGTNVVNGQIIGSCQLRDEIILFTTTNTSVTPVAGDGDSRIYKLKIDLSTETFTSLELLYDDSLNIDGTDLCFSTANPIKAIAKYETPNIQKVYWTDGYNNIRYADVAKNLTVAGAAYTLNDFMTASMFEFLPKFVPTRPTLSVMTGGRLMSGMVQYSYQLYRLNGAETAFSPVSDMIHIVNDSDTLSNTLFYSGEDEAIETGKGCKMSIVNNNIGYNRLRLIRIYYPALNAVPVIDISNEIEISTAAGTIEITDIGDVVGSLTLDEFNVASTELFKCEDIATKDNRLFAVNIEKSEFTLTNWDARAIRFRHGGAVANTDNTAEEDPTFPTITVEPGINFKVCNVTIVGFKTVLDVPIPVDRTLVDVTGVATTATLTNCIHGRWHDAAHAPTDYAAIGTDCTFGDIVYVPGTDTLTFTITTAGADFWAAGYDHIDSGDLEYIVYTYSYTSVIVYDDAVVYDGVTPLTIDTGFSNWVAGYTTTHDGINKFNDPDNDGDEEYNFRYQADCATVGAEGPNIKIDFETELFYLDTSSDVTKFYVTPPSSGTDISYKNYASPWKDGKLSWQRDEVYRLFIVFGNDRGQVADPKWICDLRMPSFHDVDFINTDGATVKTSTIALKDGSGYVTSYRLYPRVWLKSFPTNATWAQIYRVKREREDRSVVTQGLVVPSYNAIGVNYPNLIDQNLSSFNTIIKLISPEININKNISFKSNDYLQYITNYESNHEKTAEAVANSYVHKLTENTRVTFDPNCKTDIVDAISVSPVVLGGGELPKILNGLSYLNCYESGAPWGKGCTGLAIAYNNTSWTAEGKHTVIANYKSNVFNSQYGGNTYEDRGANASVVCSDIIIVKDIWYDVNGGDTFINYFDVSTILAELTTGVWADRLVENVYVPLESSVNCDLRCDTDSRHKATAPGGASLIRQEYAGTHVGPIGETYQQENDLYLYNTVYSQQTNIQTAISSMLDVSDETVFDCMIKASNSKSNGEISDSWTKFGINEFIEVDSIYGSINVLDTFNGKLFYFQDKAFGLLAVNDRSLITDNSSSQLVLGTGGVLDRYDYISTIIGCKDKFSLAKGLSGLFWYDRVNNSLIKYSDGIDKISVSKGMQSYLDNNVISTQSVISHPDLKNSEILFTFFVGGTGIVTTSFTLAYSENVDAFTSFYSFIPNIYIPYDSRYLTTTRSKYCAAAFNLDYLFLHDSDIYPRCNFYALTNGDVTKYYDSTLKLLYNDDYLYTKVWDNIFYMSNVYNTTGVELYNQTLDSIRCYNDYQNTDYVTLVYPTNLVRKERGWALAIPRNLVDVNVTSNPDIFAATSLDTPLRSFRERLRDKYMIMDLKFINGATRDKFVLSNVGVRYRSSYR